MHVCTFSSPFSFPHHFLVIAVRPVWLMESKGKKRMVSEFNPEKHFPLLPFFLFVRRENRAERAESASFHHPYLVDKEMQPRKTNMEISSRNMEISGGRDREGSASGREGDITGVFREMVVEAARELQ